MEALRVLQPKELIKGATRSKFSLWMIPWGPLALEAPSNVNMDDGILGNHGGSAETYDNAASAPDQYTGTLKEMDSKVYTVSVGKVL